jgi:hypothetical protein
MPLPFGCGLALQPVEKVTWDRFPACPSLVFISHAQVANLPHRFFHGQFKAKKFN